MSTAFSVMDIWIWLMDHCKIESMYLFFYSVSSFLYFRKSTGILFLIQKNLWFISFFYSIFCSHCFPLSYVCLSVLILPYTDSYTMHSQALTLIQNINRL